LTARVAYIIRVKKVIDVKNAEVWSLEYYITINLGVLQLLGQRNVKG
jgi:hypothetical protein